MGLLDFFGNLGNLSDEQSQGLISAGNAMMQASGPSRTPQNTMGILGGGFSSYNDAILAAKKRKIEEEERKQMALMRQMQFQELQEEMLGRQRKRKKDENIEKAYIKKYGTPSISGGQQTANNPFQSSLDPMSAVYQDGMQSSQNSPTGADTVMPLASKTDRHATSNQLMEHANWVRSIGDADGYVKALKEAMDARRDEMSNKEKWSPELRKVTTKDGKTIYVRTADDNSISEVPYGVAPDMEKTVLGGTTRWDDKNAINPGTIFTHTATPGDIISSQNQEKNRAQADRHFKERQKSEFGKPVWNNDVGGFVTPPNASNPKGKITPLDGYTKPPKPMTEDQGKATGWLVQATNAYKNMEKVLKDDPTASDVGILDVVVSSAPFGMGENAANMVRGEKRQRFIQASSSLAEAALRAATGAGINIHEAQQKIRELTPVWGDSDEVKKQKMDSIPLYIESLKARAGSGAKMADDIAANSKPSGKIAHGTKGTSSTGKPMVFNAMTQKWEYP